MKYIVSGGGGFVGKAICLRLRRLGHDVVSVSRGKYPDLEEQGVDCLQADISTDLRQFADVFKGAAAFFHTAAMVSMWGKYQDFFKVNVQGTRNVIGLCRSLGIPKLIYTSSPSVIADGTNLRGVDESHPYPQKHKAFYPATKAIAEREVLAANGEALFTLSLRPHLIWGPGDTNLVPTILKRAEAGKLKQIGKGANKVDLTFIDDCAAAHLNAMEALEQNQDCRGKSYFISQGEPVSLWDWIAEVLKRNSLPPVKKQVPVALALKVAAFCELSCKFLPGSCQPLFTRFLISEMSTDHYFDISAAKRDLGFQPRYSIAEALDLTFGPAA